MVSTIGQRNVSYERKFYRGVMSWQKKQAEAPKPCSMTGNIGPKATAGCLVLVYGEKGLVKQTGKN